MRKWTFAGRTGYNEVAEHKGIRSSKFLGKFWGISAWMLEMIMDPVGRPPQILGSAVVGALLVVKRRPELCAGASGRRCRRGVAATVAGQCACPARSELAGITARELVPGDIVRVRPGDIIPRMSNS